MPNEKTSRAVLVTGASRGIGRAIALAFAGEGDRVAVHWGGSRERAEAVLAELPGEGHVLAGADLADPEAVRAMVDGAAEALGSIDVVVNNAGVVVPHAIDEAGIPCRMVPSGMAALAGAGTAFAVTVPADRADEARELLGD